MSKPKTGRRPRRPRLHARGEWGQLTAAQQAEAQQQAEAERESRYKQPLVAGSVLPPCPASLEEVHSQLISLDREIASLERARQALCHQLDHLAHAPEPT